MSDMTPCQRDELRKLAERGQLVRCVHWINTGGHSHVPINPSVLGLLDQLDAAEAKLAAVRELHQPINAINEWVTCCECFDPADGGEWVQWPCPTIRALDEGIDHE